MMKYENTTTFGAVFLTLLLTATLALTPATAQDYQRWGLPEGATLRLGKGDIYDIAYSPDGTLLAVASSIGIWLYDTVAYGIWLPYHYQEVALLTGHTQEVTSVIFSPDGSTLASGSRDRTVRLWDVATGDTRQTLVGHWDDVLSVVFSPDGSTLASGGFDDTIRLWDVATGETRQTLTGHTRSVLSVVFSPDGSTLASGGFDDTIRLWDVATGETRQTLTGHTGGVSSVVFSPDGSTLASGSRDKTIRLWDVATGETRQTLTGHTGGVSSVVFSPDSAILASGSHDGTVRLWDVARGTTLTTRIGHTFVVSSVVFSLDGSTLASGSWDGTVLLWPLAQPTQIAADLNGDGIVTNVDLALVALRFGHTGADIPADVNRDGAVTIADLLLVAAAIDTKAVNEEAAEEGETPAAPAAQRLTATEVQAWLTQAQGLDLANPAYRRGIAVLEQLLAALSRRDIPVPKETALLANYPNPFNPETWIPYQLAAAAEVTLTIHAADGRLVRTLALGQLPAGIYQTRTRAAYWDGRNAQGEPVASGIYFYTLQAGDFIATKKMVIRK